MHGEWPRHSGTNQHRHDYLRHNGFGAFPSSALVKAEAQSSKRESRDRLSRLARAPPDRENHRRKNWRRASIPFFCFFFSSDRGRPDRQRSVVRAARGHSDFGRKGCSRANILGKEGSVVNLDVERSPSRRRFILRSTFHVGCVAFCMRVLPLLP